MFRYIFAEFSLVETLTDRNPTPCTLYPREVLIHRIPIIHILPGIALLPSETKRTLPHSVARLWGCEPNPWWPNSRAQKLSPFRKSRQASRPIDSKQLSKHSASTRVRGRVCWGLCAPMAHERSHTSFDFRQRLDATYTSRCSAAFFVLAPASAVAYSISIRGHLRESVLVHTAMLLSTRAFIAGLLAAVSPHEPTGSASKVALAAIVIGNVVSLIAAIDRWTQPSASEGEHMVRVGVAVAPVFLWLWFLYGYSWRHSLAAWEGFRLCAAGTNCFRLLGLLLLRFLVSPIAESYPPGQLPFETAFACNLALILLVAALTPSNRMRLALLSGLHTVNLSQLPRGHCHRAQHEIRGEERDPAAAASTQGNAQGSAQAHAQASEWRRSFCSSAASTDAHSHDSLGAELPGLRNRPLGFEANVGLRYRTPSAVSHSRASFTSQELPLLSPQMQKRLEASLSTSGLSSRSEDGDQARSDVCTSCSEGSRASQYGVIPE